MPRVWYVGDYPYREITSQDWDKLGVFGPFFQWSADNGWSVDQDLFYPEHLAYLELDPEFILNKTGPRPDAPVPPDDVTRPYRLDPLVLKILDDATAALASINITLGKAETSEANAKASENKAKTSETNAKTSETNAKTSETKAKTSETNSKTSETNAATSATNAAGVAAASQTSAVASSGSATEAKASETKAKTSETNAKTSETNAKTSETNSAASRAAAETAKTLAETAASAAEQAKMTWRGEWVPTSAYALRDVVSYGGSSYWASAAVAANQPAPPAGVWKLLAAKGDTGSVGTHTHVITDTNGLETALNSKLDKPTTGTPSATTYPNGAGGWTTPPNTTYAVPTQAEAEAGTATTGRAFSAQRVRQAILALTWTGTQAQYDAIVTKDPAVTYNIVEA